MIFSEAKLRNFPDNRLFIAKKNCDSCFFRHAFGARVLASAYRSRANLSIALYSRGKRVVCCTVILFLQRTVFEMQYFREFREIALHFGCLYSVGLLDVESIGSNVG